MLTVTDWTVDHIAVTESGFVEVRKVQRTMDGDTEVKRAYHRHVLKPGADLSGETPEVVAAATQAWA